MVGPSTSSRRRALLTGTDSGRDALRQIVVALTALAAVVVVGTVGYVALGFPLLDAVYQTVTTVATVGFREVRPLGPGARRSPSSSSCSGWGPSTTTSGSSSRPSPRATCASTSEGAAWNTTSRGCATTSSSAGSDGSGPLQEDLDTVARELNGRPRQTLGWANPADTLTKYLVNGEPF